MISGCRLGLPDPFLRRSRSGRFALGYHDDPGLMALLDFLNQERGAPELDVVRVWTNGQDLHEALRFLRSSR